MELDSLLIQVQGALITLKRNRGLQRDSQEESVENTIFYQSIEKIRNSCNNNERDMRRVHLYILLNSDFKFNDSLIEDENFSHIVSTTPIIDKYLVAETFLMLDGEKYMNETIIFGHPSIGLEYLEVITTILERRRDLRYIQYVESFIAVIHNKLSLLTSIDTRDKKENEVERRKFYSYYDKLLNLFSPPHEKCKLGYVVKSLLSLLISFIDNRYEFLIPLDSDHSLYSMSLPHIQNDDRSEAIISMEENGDIHKILSILKSNLLLLDLSIWMDWFEIEWKSTRKDSATKNIQQVVGELAYICKEKLSKASMLDEETEIINTVLSSIAIKPFCEDEEIEKTKNLDKILQKVRDESLEINLRKKWLIALLNVPKSLLEKDCFKCIEDFVPYLCDSKEIILLLERARELISFKSSLGSQNSEEYYGEVENIKGTVLKIFSQLSLEDQGKLIELYLVKYGLPTFFDTRDYDKIMTEYLNKVVNSSEEGGRPISESGMLCFQSPNKYFQGLLNLAICNGQIPFAMSVFLPLSNLCHLQLENTYLCGNESIRKDLKFLCGHINSLMKRKHWNELEISNFVLLMVQVEEYGILQLSDIFHEILHPNIKEFLENKLWNSVNLCIKTMHELISKSNIKLSNFQNAAVLLAVLLQVLEKGRQEMREEFSSSAASTCELLTSYLPQIVEKMLVGNLIEGNSLEWLNVKVLCSFPLSKVYFKFLPNGTNKESIYKSFQKILMNLFFGSTENSEAKLMELMKNQPNVLCYLLFKLLPSCSTSEWINIVQAMKQTVALCQPKIEQNILHTKLIFILSNVLLVMIAVMTKKGSSMDNKSFHIIELYMKNFVRVLKEVFWPCSEILGIEDSCKVFESIVSLLNLIPKEENVQEACSLLVLNILSDIIQSVPVQNLEKSQSDPAILKLATSISLLSDFECRKSLSRIFLENIKDSQR